jgi:salicylate hydroxylase
MIQLVPDGITEFNKRIEDMRRDTEGVQVFLDDGTTVRASAVIACDGVKSLARKVVLGVGSTEVAPVVIGKYAYRNLFTRAEACQILATNGQVTGISTAVKEHMW